MEVGDAQRMRRDKVKYHITLGQKQIRKLDLELVLFWMELR